MAFPTTANPMGGIIDVQIDSVVVTGDFLGPVSSNVAQVLRTSERLTGTTTTPSNQLDNPSFDLTFYPNEWADLQYFMPENYEGTPGSNTGPWVLGGATCDLPDPVEVVFHYRCDDGTTRDITMPSTRVSFEDSSERNATDDLSVTIHLYPQPTEDGQIIYGTPATS